MPARINEEWIAPTSDVGELLSFRVAEVREMRCLTVEAVGERASIHWKYLERFERGEVGMQPYLLRRLAAALGVTVEELLYEPELQMRAERSTIM